MYAVLHRTDRIPQTARAHASTKTIQTCVNSIVYPAVYKQRPQTVSHAYAFPLRFLACYKQRPHGRQHSHVLAQHVGVHVRHVVVRMVQLGDRTPVLYLLMAPFSCFMQIPDLDEVYHRRLQARDHVKAQLSAQTLRQAMRRCFPFPCTQCYTAVAMRENSSRNMQEH